MYEFIIENPVLFWSVTGVVLFIIEVASLSLVFFLFSGLSAISVAILVSLSLIPEDNFFLQLAIFSVLTTIYIIFLIKPLRKFKNSKKYGFEGTDKGNFIGKDATIIEPPKHNNIGSVKWSGTIMRAKLLNQSEDGLKKDDLVYIHNIEGNILYISKKPYKKIGE